MDLRLLKTYLSLNKYLSCTHTPNGTNCAFKDHLSVAAAEGDDGQSTGGAVSAEELDDEGDEEDKDTILQHKIIEAQTETGDKAEPHTRTFILKWTEAAIFI